MKLVNEVQRYIRGDNHNFCKVREKLKIVPTTLDDIKSITKYHNKLQLLLTDYYMKKKT